MSTSESPNVKIYRHKFKLNDDLEGQMNSTQDEIDTVTNKMETLS